MSSAASAAPPADQPAAAARRKTKPGLTRRSGLQLLAGLLLAAGIPVVATMRILNASALRNQQARADSALRDQLRGTSDELRGRADDASTRAHDVSSLPVLQRAFLTNDRAAIKRLAAKTPGIVFYVHGRRVAGTVPAIALKRSVSLALDGRPVGRVVAAIAVDQKLLKRLFQASPHARGDRLLMVRGGTVVGSAEHVRISGRTIHLAGVRYRGFLTAVPNAPGTNLLALRSEASIVAAVKPYQERVMYAALGSFGLLVLVGLLFGGPILRTLGDFRRVASQAATDSLTGLANRWTFDEELALEWRRAERVGDPLALILLDIDDFKTINDGHGHQAGDEVLRKVGEVLAAGVRQVDLAARYGGEEFAVIVPETDLDGAIDLAERLRKALASEVIELQNGTRLSVTASFGAAVKDDLSGGEKLVAAADELLYEAKRAGKDRVAPEPAKKKRSASKPAERRRRPAQSKSKTKKPAG
jgi:diguanylate cyclase (GGDEF)-like protein